MISFNNSTLLIAVILFLGVSGPAPAQVETHDGNVIRAVPAFPGAQGFGRDTRGGRGGKVIKVSNLEDAGPGSLRHAIRQKMPRTVVFEVSGTISLEKELKVNHGHLTIAGQTSPGDGITLKNYGLVIGADEVIVRYIRARPGNDSGVETDAISVKSGSNIIIDHCSASWATDETLSVSPTTKDMLRQIDRVTVQWCIISESLNASIHSKGNHGYGSLVRGSGGSRYSFHHNLWAHHQARMPRPGNYMDAESDPEGAFFDFRNNVFYNWGNKTSGYNADTRSVSRYNFINNYYLSGVDSGRPLAFDESNSLSKSHFSGNFMNHEEPADPWSLVHFRDGRASSSDLPFPAGQIDTDPAPVAFRRVLSFAGASHKRDGVDKRVVSDVLASKGRIIDDEMSVGGWPDLEPGEPRPDGDGDGMPDQWEISHGLDPADPDDGSRDRNNDGYTNLEEFINSLIPPASYLPGPAS